MYIYLHIGKKYQLQKINKGNYNAKYISKSDVERNVCAKQFNRNSFFEKELVSNKYEDCSCGNNIQ